MPVRRNRAAKGKNSTPRVDEKARSVTNPTTKDLVKVAFFFDESDDEDQFPDGSSFLGGLSPIRGVHGRPNMLLSPANASTFSIPSEPLKPKNQIAPYRFIMPKHLLKRPLASLSTNTFAKPNATKVSVFEATKRQKLKEKPKPAPSKSKATDTQEKENNSNVQQSNVEKVKVSEPEAKKAAAPRNAFTVLQEKKTAKPAPRRTTRAAKKKTTPPKEEKLHQSKIFEVIENEERVPVKQLRSRKKKAPAVEEPDTEEEAELDEEYRESNSRKTKGRKTAKSKGKANSTKTYCNRVVNTSVGASPEKKSFKEERDMEKWASLQSSHFSEVDEFELTFA